MAIGQVMCLAVLSVSLAFSLQEFFSEMNTADEAHPSASYSDTTHSPREGALSSYATTSSSSRTSSTSMGGAHFSHGSSSPSHHSGYTPTIAPIIPGVNFPIEYVCEFWLVTFGVIVVHEFGHAAAASLERLQIQGCGTFFLFIFPGEFN